MTQIFDESIQSLNIANMTTSSALGSIYGAESFFPKQSLEEIPSTERPSVSSDNDGLINVILLSNEVSNNLQQLLDEQK